MTPQRIQEAEDGRTHTGFGTPAPEATQLPDWQETDASSPEYIQNKPDLGPLATQNDATAARSVLGLGTLATQNGTFSGTSSGTNTGDQTNISGNSGTATALQTARLLNGTSFNGTANVTIPSAGGGVIGTASFDVSGGAVAGVTADGIISGVAYNATGNFTASFGGAQPNTNYVVSLACDASGSPTPLILNIVRADKSTGGFTFTTNEPTKSIPGNEIDPVSVQISVMRLSL